MLWCIAVSDVDSPVSGTGPGTKRLQEVRLALGKGDGRCSLLEERMSVTRFAGGVLPTKLLHALFGFQCGPLDSVEQQKTGKCRFLLKF